jgi:diguanylate cyclase (GGDEF)-like protein
VYRRKKRIAVVSVVLYMLAYYIWILLYKGNQTNKTIISDILQIIPPAITFVILIKAHLKARLFKDFFWLLLAIGCGSYLISQFVWNYYEIFLGIYNPVFFWSGLCWGTSILCYIIAVSNKIKEKRDRNWTKLLIVDTMTITCVAIAITWLYTIEPQIAKINIDNIWFNLLYLMYPVGNLICLFVVINLYMSLKPDDPERRSLYLIALAFLVMFAANTIYSHLAVSNSYHSASLMDPLWALYLLILGLAGLDYITESEKKNDLLYKGSLMRLLPKITVALPILSVVSLFALMIFIDDRFVWICTSLSIILITVRHAIVTTQSKQLIVDLEQLNSSLETKVSDRTQELFDIAFYDQLTGLPNRRMFENSLKKSVIMTKKKNGTLALLLLDLDRFKTINDTFGHSYGDTMLKIIALRLKEAIGSICTISRQGGDEFAIILEDYIHKQEIVQIAERILSEVAKPINLSDHNIYTSCSIGISLYSNDCADQETLMRYADAAMYYSKERGKNTYQFYTSELDKSISKKLELETELGKAIENNEFCLFYQPQVNILNGAITGAEALIRWMHPVYGCISPTDFIPIAEETGMINEIGLWVLENACTQAKKLQSEGIKRIKIGVNISPKQIQHDDFVHQVGKIIRKTGVYPQLLDLEITESAAFQNESDITRKLNDLKKIGVKISIDDFGTGYSSLSYLNKLPVDTLKIAQEFVKQIQSDAKYKAIIASIIAVTQNLKLKVIAEGVEDMYEYEFLKSQGCFDMQGYMFSKPVPIEEFIMMVKNNVFAKDVQLDA